MNTVRDIKDWLVERGDFTVLMAALVAVFAVWAFVELADEVLEGDTAHFDERLLRALRQPDDPSVTVGPPWLAETARDFSALGGVSVLTLLTAAVAGFLILRKQYGALTFLLVAVAGGLAVSTVLKVSFNRPRPEIVPHLAYVSSASFPSGHSMLSAVVYLTLGALLARLVQEKRLKLYFLGVALALTLLVGVSRVFVGVHYPSDVLAGWTAGLAWAVICWLSAYWLQKRGRLELPEEDSTGARRRSARLRQPGA